MAAQTLSGLIPAYISYHPPLLSGGSSYLLLKHATLTPFQDLCTCTFFALYLLSLQAAYILFLGSSSNATSSANPFQTPPPSEFISVCAQVHARARVHTHVHTLVHSSLLPGFHHGTYILQTVSVFTLMFPPRSDASGATCHVPLAHPASSCSCGRQVPANSDFPP